jgi:hypothetical protein
MLLILKWNARGEREREEENEEKKPAIAICITQAKKCIYIFLTQTLIFIPRLLSLEDLLF